MCWMCICKLPNVFLELIEIFFKNAHSNTAGSFCILGFCWVILRLFNGLYMGVLAMWGRSSGFLWIDESLSLFCNGMLGHVQRYAGVSNSATMVATFIYYTFICIHCWSCGSRCACFPLTSLSASRQISCYISINLIRNRCSNWQGI